MGGGGVGGRGEAETQCFLLRFNHTSRKQSLLKTVYTFDTNPPLCQLTYLLAGG